MMVSRVSPANDFNTILPLVGSSAYDHGVVSLHLPVVPQDLATDAAFLQKKGNHNQLREGEFKQLDASFDKAKGITDSYGLHGTPTRTKKTVRFDTETAGGDTSLSKVQECSRSPNGPDVWKSDTLSEDDIISNQNERKSQRSRLWWSVEENMLLESERRELIREIHRLGKARPELASTFSMLYQDCASLSTFSQVLRTKAGKAVCKGDDDVILKLRGLESKTSKLFSLNRKRHSQQLLSAQQEGYSTEQIRAYSVHSSRPSKLMARVFAHADAIQAKEEEDFL